tara:strand:- start:1642 stop:1824 length:183 start_codon:yes stop_codon:yes gene_type:complete
MVELTAQAEIDKLRHERDRAVELLRDVFLIADGTDPCVGRDYMIRIGAAAAFLRELGESG